MIVCERVARLTFLKSTKRTFILISKPFVVCCFAFSVIEITFSLIVVLQQRHIIRYRYDAMDFDEENEKRLPHHINIFQF